jgi:hypothetical protein
MTSSQAAMRRRFTTRFVREMEREGFARTDHSYALWGAGDNAIVYDLQAAPAYNRDMDSCTGIYINVGILLGIEIEWLRRTLRSASWQPSPANGVWNDRLRRDGIDWPDLWSMCSVAEADQLSTQAIDLFRQQLPRLKHLLDPEHMIAAARAERWSRNRVLEGYLLADHGRLGEVEELLDIAGTPVQELLEHQRSILGLAHHRAGLTTPVAQLPETRHEPTAPTIGLGQFGALIVARYADQLEHLEAVASLSLPVDEIDYAHDWHVGFLPTMEYVDPVELAIAVTTETGRPTIALYDNDGDYAEGYCHSPDGNTGRFYLNEQAFRAFIAELDTDQDEPARRDTTSLMPVAEPVALLANWAVEAGLAPNRPALTAALTPSTDYPNNTVGQLISALGIHPPSHAEPRN